MNIDWLKQRWKGWKEKNFLETYGCKTWKEYERKYDQDFSPGAREISRVYHGYPHVVPYPFYHSHSEFSHTKVNEMIAWCEKNCTGKWRNDWHRVMWDKWNQDWIENGIGGGDYMFFAFKNGEDETLFRLVWQ